MATKGSRRGPRTIDLVLPKQGDTRVYANARVADALVEITKDMTLYHGVRLLQVLEAAYEQGLRDGRGNVFAELDQLKNKPELKYRNPGRPPGSRDSKPRKKRVSRHRRKAANKSTAMRRKKQG